MSKMTTADYDHKITTKAGTLMTFTEAGPALFNSSR